MLCRMPLCCLSQNLSDVFLMITLGLWIIENHEEKCPFHHSISKWIEFCYGLNCVSPKYMLTSSPPVPHNVTLFRNMVFTEMIKYNEVIRMGSNLI